METYRIQMETDTEQKRDSPKWERIFLTFDRNWSKACSVRILFYCVPFQIYTFRWSWHTFDAIISLLHKARQQSEARQHHYPLKNLRNKKLALYIIYVVKVSVVRFSNNWRKFRYVLKWNGGESTKIGPTFNL